MGLENIDFPLSRHQGSRTKRWLARDTMEEVEENKMIFLVKKKKKKSLALFVDIMEGLPKKRTSTLLSPTPRKERWE